MLDGLDLKNPAELGNTGVLKKAKLFYYQDIYDNNLDEWKTPLWPNIKEKEDLFAVIRALVLNLGSWLQLPTRDSSSSREQNLGIVSKDSSSRLPLVLWSTNSIYRFIKFKRVKPDNAHQISTQLISRGPSNSGSSKRFWKEVYQEENSRKQSDLWWLTIHNGLKLGRRLLHLGEVSQEIISNNKHLCPCCAIEQNRDHLFATCQITIEGWNRFFRFIERIAKKENLVVTPLTLTEILRGLPKIRDKVKELNKPIISLCARMLNALWNARNKNHFENKE